jgi:AP-3 complex subunit delta-1
LLGIDISQYAFHIIQSMSLKHEKKTGYLAASISFNQNTPVLIMATNLIKKDLRSNDQRESIMALHTLAQIVSHDLARDLHQDVILMLNNSNPFIRKRAILVLYRMFLKYPDCLVEAFPRLRDRLEDDDPAVISCCVTVICELGRMNPKAYLPLAPQLFSLFVGSANNWMLIKMVKLFAALTPLEPRLIRKLLPPLKKIIQNTRAISVVYECVNTVITGGMLDSQVGDEEIASLCIQRLQGFLEQKDQNLKYLGLAALSKLLHIRPEIVSQNRQMILQCLEDGDMSIRLRALELVSGLISPKTLFGIVKRLLVTLSNSETNMFSPEELQYRTKVGKCIILACSKDMYANLTNFEWYLQVLIDLARHPGVDIADEIKDQLFDICIRVPEVRQYACELMVHLID